VLKVLLHILTEKLNNLKFFKTIKARFFFSLFLLGFFSCFLHYILLFGRYRNLREEGFLFLIKKYLLLHGGDLMLEFVLIVILVFLVLILISYPLNRLLKLVYAFNKINVDSKTNLLKFSENELKKLEELSKKRIEEQDDKQKKLQEMLLRRSQKILEREKNQRELLNLFADVIYTVDNNQRLTSIKHSKRLFGYEEKDLLGRKSLEVVHPEDRGKLIEKIREIRLKENKIIRDLKLRFLTKSGDFRYALLSTHLLVEKGKVIGREGILKDITDREKLAQKVLHEKEKLQEAYKSLSKSYLALGQVNAQVAALAEINMTFSSNLTWKEKLHYIIESIRVFMHAEETLLFLDYEKEGNYTFYKASCDSENWKETEIYNAESLIEEIRTFCKPLKLYEKDYIWQKELFFQQGYKACLVIPVIINNQVIGVFMVLFKESETLKEMQTTLILAYTSQMSLALMMSGLLDLDRKC